MRSPKGAQFRFAFICLAVVSAASCAGETDEGNGSHDGGTGQGGAGGMTTGAAGTSGAAGTTGAAGNVSTGDAGTTGNAGTTGSAGTTGDAGTTGAAGSGTTGTAGRGGAGGTGGSAGRGGAGGIGGGAGRGGAGGMAGTAAGGTTGVAGSAAGRGGTTGTAGSGGTGGVPPGPTVTWSPNVRLNDDTGSGRQSEVALATGPNGLALAGWMDERSTRVCGFSFSTNGGQTWSKNVSIPNNTGMFVGDPAVAIDGGGTMYAICQEYLTISGSTTTGNIRMMTSTDKGVTWSAVRTIGSAPDKPWGGGGVTDGVVFVSWLGNPGGIKRSTDHGMTWGPTQSTGNIIHGTGITTSNTGLVHVPYNLDSQNNQLRYLRSKNNGDTWEATRDLVANMGTFCFSCNPRQHPIVGSAADPTGKYVAITWASRMTGGQSDDDVWLLYSKDGGDTWSSPIRVNDNTAASRQFESWVAVDKYGRVHVAWTDLRDGGNNETWYARSADPTKGFEPNMQITDGHGSANTDFLGDYKGIAVSGNDVLVVWEDTRRSGDGGDIYFSRAVGAAGP
ncbi:MAG TPA: sialidase family protein [Polyangia bacterium]|nr:sialidase family protein [Polyangia bacterium]